jgi:hypothetical protein
MFAKQWQNLFCVEDCVYIYCICRVGALHPSVNPLSQIGACQTYTNFGSLHVPSPIYPSPLTYIHPHHPSRIWSHTTTHSLVFFIYFSFVDFLYVFALPRNFLTRIPPPPPPPCRFHQPCPEPVFVNDYGAQELIPRNRFHQSMSLGRPIRQIGFRTGPPGWESIPGLHKRSTNTGSVLMYPPIIHPFCLIIILSSFICLSKNYYFLHQCFIFYSSDSTVSVKVGIEPRTVSTMAMAVIRSVRSHPRLLKIFRYFLLLRYCVQPHCHFKPPTPHTF